MTDALQHWGVLGMHWGVSSGRGSTSSPDHARAASLKKKKLHEMSNDELRALTTRVQLETQYRNIKPSKVARGKKHVDNVLGAMGYITSAAGTITAAAVIGKKIYTYAKSPAGRAAIAKARLAAQTAKNLV